MEAHLNIKFKNTDEFKKLTDEVTQKARELEILVHKLRTFKFECEVQPSVDAD